jgi:hypothetical protein
MQAGRLGRGALTATVAAVVVLAGMFFLDWYSFDEHAIAPVQIERSYLAQTPSAPTQVPNDLSVSAPSNFSAWDGADWLAVFANFVILAAALRALWTAFSLAREAPLSAGAWGGLLYLSALAVLMVLLRMIFPVEEGTSLEAGIWVTLLGTLGLVAGALMLRAEAAPARRTPTS